MKLQRTLFRWFAIIMAFVMFFQSGLVLPSVSAQGENTPTSTSTSGAVLSCVSPIGSYTTCTQVSSNTIRIDFNVPTLNEDWERGYIIHNSVPSTYYFKFHWDAGGWWYRYGFDANDTSQARGFSVGLVFLAYYGQESFFAPVAGNGTYHNNGVNYWIDGPFVGGDYSGMSNGPLSDNGPRDGGWPITVSLGWMGPLQSLTGYRGTGYLIVSSVPIENTPTPSPTATSTPTYDCTGTPDPFEPDNTSSTGSPIIIGEEQRHSLCPQNDEDWVNFDTSANNYFNRNALVETFDLEPNSLHPNGDTQLTVLDESAINQIGKNQFRGFGPFPGSTDVLQSSRVVWHPAADGIFNIRVSPEKQISEQEGSGYSLRMANPLTMLDPVDQGSWSPTRVNVPYVSRFDNGFYFIQYFTYDQAELDALNAVRASLAWEFRRPAVDTNTGIEIQDSIVDYVDYWQSVNGVCVEGEYWTNLPSHSDRFVEESNSIDGCRHNPSWSEEFELYVDDPTELVAGKLYFVMVKFYIHDEYLNSNYQFYISKVEYCELWLGIFNRVCNLGTIVPKYHANLIEGYLQPTP